MQVSTNSTLLVGALHPPIGAHARMRRGRRAIGRRVHSFKDDDGDQSNLSWIVEQQRSLQMSSEKEEIEAELAASGTSRPWPVCRGPCRPW